MDATQGTISADGAIAHLAKLFGERAYNAGFSAYDNKIMVPKIPKGFFDYTQDWLDGWVAARAEERRKNVIESMSNMPVASHNEDSFIASIRSGMSTLNQAHV